MSRVVLPSPVACPIDSQRVVVRAIVDDSRQLEAGDLFLLLPAVDADQPEVVMQGYLQQAVACGVAAVVSVGGGGLSAKGTVPHLVLGTMEEAGQWLRRVLQTYADHVPCIGVTGTDGKTSITWMLRQALQRLRGCCWSLGTLGWMEHQGCRRELANTTPSLLTMQQALAEAGAAGAGALVCEVSSHGIAQQRIAAMPFSSVLWSNIGRDHLQDHGGMDAYIGWKARFVRRVVDQGGVAVANADQPLVMTALQGMGDSLCWYGRSLDKGDNHLRWVSTASDKVALHYGGEQLLLERVPVAAFHHENLAAAAALLLHSGIASFAQLPELLSDMSTPPGRMEQVADGVFVDYAHTPEALAALLASARKLCRGRLLLVFGCGGGRDHSKRAQMGEVAARDADMIWLTEDNSRDEQPQAIVQQVVAGMGRARLPVVVELNRERAIAAALQAQEDDDVVLIAGKGHETSIERAGKRIPWCDADGVQRLLGMDTQERTCR